MLETESLGYRPSGVPGLESDIFYDEKVRIYRRCWHGMLRRTFPGDTFHFSWFHPFSNDDPDDKNIYIVWDPEVPESLAAGKYVVSSIPEKWDSHAKVLVDRAIDKLYIKIQAGEIS